MIHKLSGIIGLTCALLLVAGILYPAQAQPLTTRGQQTQSAPPPSDALQSPNEASRYSESANPGKQDTTEKISNALRRRKIYVESCLSKSDPRLTSENQYKLCDCTGDKMIEVMSEDDIRAMSGQDQAARNALNKMLTEVYAPCIQYPVSGILESACLKDTNLTLGSAAQKNLCACYGKNIGEYLATAAPDLMRQELSQNPNLTDPLTPILEAPGFYKVAQNILMQCMK